MVYGIWYMIYGATIRCFKVILFEMQMKKMSPRTFEVTKITSKVYCIYKQ